MTDTNAGFEEFRERVDAARMAMLPELFGRLHLDATGLRELQEQRGRGQLVCDWQHEESQISDLRLQMMADSNLKSSEI